MSYLGNRIKEQKTTIEIWKAKGLCMVCGNKLIKNLYCDYCGYTKQSQGNEAKSSKTAYEDCAGEQVRG